MKLILLFILLLGVVVDSTDRRHLLSLIDARINQYKKPTTKAVELTKEKQKPIEKPTTEAVELTTEEQVEESKYSWNDPEKMLEQLNEGMQEAQEAYGKLKKAWDAYKERKAEKKKARENQEKNKNKLRKNRRKDQNVDGANTQR